MPWYRFAVRVVIKELERAGLASSDY
jgi:hypothetical protein